MRAPLVQSAILAVALALGPVLSAHADQPSPSPAPSSSFPHYEPTVSASIAPGQSDVGYQGSVAGDESSSRSRGQPSRSGGGCTGLSYTSAVAKYGDRTVSQWLYGSTWFAYVPIQLPEVGQTPDAENVGDYHNMYFVMCGGKATAYGYVYPSASGPTPATARTVAQSVAGDIPLPGVSIEVAPSPKGLTGFNGWYWVGGMPAGGVFAASADVLGATVNVQARPTSFIWSFGDGTQLTTASPGVAYPGPDGPSAVHHVYQALDESPGYQLSLTFVLEVRYQVNAGAWTNLGTVQRTISLTYPVEEIVSSIVSRS
jgi:hypothetical protein